MITIALFNNKGGVGKTTLAYHLAHMFRRLDYSVLAVDLDPQANLTSAFFRRRIIGGCLGREGLWQDRPHVCPTHSRGHR